MHDFETDKVFKQPDVPHRTYTRDIAWECIPCNPEWRFAMKTCTRPAIICGTINRIFIYGDTLAGLVFPNRSVIDKIHRIILHYATTQIIEGRTYIHHHSVPFTPPFSQPIVELAREGRGEVVDDVGAKSTRFILVPWACSFLSVEALRPGLTIEMYGPDRNSMTENEIMDVVHSMICPQPNSNDDNQSSTIKNKHTPKLFSILYGCFSQDAKGKFDKNHLFAPLLQQRAFESRRPKETQTTPPTSTRCWLNLNGGSDPISTWLCRHSNGTSQIYRHPKSLQTICWQRMSVDQKCTYLRQHGPYTDLPSVMTDMPVELQASLKDTDEDIANEPTIDPVVVPCFASYPRFIYSRHEDVATATLQSQTTSVIGDSPTIFDYLFCAEDKWKKDSVQTDSGVYVLHDGRFNILPTWEQIV